MESLKKVLSNWKNNEKGFFFPYIIVICAIIFIIFTSYIASYQNELKITENNLEQMELETLLRMGYQSFWFKEDYLKESESKFFYHFPNGEVTITKTITNPNEINLLIEAITLQKSAYYIVRKENILNYKTE